MRCPKKTVFNFSSLIAIILGFLLVSCANPHKQAQQADENAYNIIQKAQQVSLGKAEPFSVERPSDTLRRKLFKEQALLVHNALLEMNSANNNDNQEIFSSDSNFSPYKLSLLQALQAGAQNSREYQSRKEELFRAALNLDLESNEFRHSLEGLLGTLFNSNHSSGDGVNELLTTAEASLAKKFEAGVELTTRIGIDLVKLFTQGESSSLGLWGDATILIPLLRGAGRDVVREPLTQAERSVLYEIYSFEQYKANFVVGIIQSYLQVLQTMDQVSNTKENYQKLEEAVVRAQRLSDAGRLPEIQVAQAVQDSLRARENWLRLSQSYARELDNLKLQLGLPPDARIRLDKNELKQLTMAGFQGISPDVNMLEQDSEQLFFSPDDAQDEVKLNDRYWLEKALANRLDLRIPEGRLADAQRKLKVAANAFLPGLNLELSAAIGETRPLGSSGLDDAELRFDRGRYSLGLFIDSPFNKTPERIAYRTSLLELDEAFRNFERAEDTVKLEVRNQIRNVVEYREQLTIQEKALEVAKWRVDATEMLLQSGRIEMRDLLDARDSFVIASDNLTAAKLNYKLSELDLMRVVGILKVTNQGVFDSAKEPEPADIDRHEQ